MTRILFEFQTKGFESKLKSFQVFETGQIEIKLETLSGFIKRGFNQTSIFSPFVFIYHHLSSFVSLFVTMCHRCSTITFVTIYQYKFQFVAISLYWPLFVLVLQTSFTVDIILLSLTRPTRKSFDLGLKPPF